MVIKRHYKENENHFPKWEEIFPMHITSEGLVSRMYEDPLNK